MCHSERRLKLWLDGDISTLLHEGRCIQRYLPSPTNQEDNQEKTTLIFSRLMLKGKVNAALRFISKDTKQGILSLDTLIPTGKDLDGEITWQTTIDILREKHPKGKVAPAETLVPESESHVAECYHDLIVFEQITGEAIKQAALHTHGAAGPCGVDPYMPGVSSVHLSSLLPLTSAMLWQLWPDVSLPPMSILMV